VTDDVGVLTAGQFDHMYLLSCRGLLFWKEYRLGTVTVPSSKRLLLQTVEFMLKDFDGHYRTALAGLLATRVSFSGAMRGGQIWVPSGGTVSCDVTLEGILPSHLDAIIVNLRGELHPIPEEQPS